VSALPTFGPSRPPFVLSRASGEMAYDIDPVFGIMFTKGQCEMSKAHTIKLSISFEPLKQPI
jgi:hypothetical protein